jgi:hypothetical protein
MKDSLIDHKLLKYLQKVILLVGEIYRKISVLNPIIGL